MIYDNLYMITTGAKVAWHQICSEKFFTPLWSYHPKGHPTFSVFAFPLLEAH